MGEAVMNWDIVAAAAASITAVVLSVLFYFGTRDGFNKRR